MLDKNIYFYIKGDTLAWIVDEHDHTGDANYVSIKSKILQMRL